MGSVVGFVIEFIVVILLGFTVAYCIILDRKLQRLRADEKSIRQTVVDLGLATERAERAIDGLRQALTDCDKTLGERLRAAENVSADLQETIKSGDEVLGRIGRIVSTAKRAVSEAEEKMQPAAPLTPPAPANVSETLAAAEAFALRARRRIMDAAA
jgi:chromosome segregation ATPase